MQVSTASHTTPQFTSPLHLLDSSSLKLTLVLKSFFPDRQQSLDNVIMEESMAFFLRNSKNSGHAIDGAATAEGFSPPEFCHTRSTSC
jgi:hypothetical protein